ncbi:hypothetical protein JYG38_11375 [Pseudomonas rhodesiae]|uniref:hypothetical protein n=1 Tax=Pseudomonas rhodesiae TaxID=76760 RepID=UPI001BCCE0B2|nr:hypothetical protein [Pseudomonas rhodesiae]QVN04025.1 hypothetical protein JYG38_11375 [Pseudomonas rhodesiae]
MSRWSLFAILKVWAGHVVARLEDSKLQLIAKSSDTGDTFNPSTDHPNIVIRQGLPFRFRIRSVIPSVTRGATL